MNKIAQVDIGSTFNSPFGVNQGFGNLISVLLFNAVIFAGIILFFFILFGGFKVIQGAGNNDPKSTAQGKQAITAAAIGFVIIFASYWIVQIIEYFTGLSILRGWSLMTP